MNLTDLQEARYHIEHPLVVEIRAAIESREWKWEKNLKGDNVAAFDVLERGFGDPSRLTPEGKDRYAVAQWTLDDGRCLTYIFGKANQGATNFLYFTRCLQV